MMRKLLLLLLTGVVGVMPAFAQDDDCPAEMVRAWLEARDATFDELMALDAEATDALTLDLIIEMQAARREFALVEAPSCAAEAALYTHLLFANVIDYWLATYAGEFDTAADIATLNGPLVLMADTLVADLRALVLPASGAFGGGADAAPAPSPRGDKVVIWEDREYFTTLDGLAFVNDIDLAFAGDEITEETLASLDDPDVGAVMVSWWVCDEDNMASTIPALGEFVSSGGHLWVFYYDSWVDCNDLTREHLGFVLAEDYHWRVQSIPQEALWPWLAGLDIDEGGGDYFGVYPMTREEGDAGYAEYGDAARLMLMSYPYSGGRVTLFPGFSGNSMMEDGMIDNYDHQEASLRILQFLATGQPPDVPEPAEPES